MQSIKYPAKGTCGISKCNHWVHILLGRNCIQSLQVLICWCTSLHMLIHKKQCLIMLTVQLIPWCPLALWNCIMIRDANFLSTTIASSIIYLSLIMFLRVLLWSNRKLGSGFCFMSLTLLLQNQSCCCSFLSTSK